MYAPLTTMADNSPNDYNRGIANNKYAPQNHIPDKHSGPIAGYAYESTGAITLDQHRQPPLWSMPHQRCPERHSRPVGLFQRSEEHTSELQSRGHLVCRLLLEKKKKNRNSD